MIVCVEGIDAAGKDTQAALLVSRLNAKLWKFPDRRTITGKAIYEHLNGDWTVGLADEGLADRDLAKEKQVDALVFQALQLANRMEVATDIFQAAAKGNVVFNRYWPSGYAYGKADGLDGDYLISLHHWLPQPNLFLLLDIDLDQSAQRRPDRRDRYERDGLVVTKAAENYRELWARQAQKEPLRWVVVNARGSQEETALQINTAVAAVRAQQDY